MKSLENVTIAITGSSGDLGREISFKLAHLGANLVFINRNLRKSEELSWKIKEKYPDVKIKVVECDLADLSSVKLAVLKLESIAIDVLILNSGIYNVPLKILDTGYNNVFQVNFLSQFYLVNKLVECGKIKKVIAVGSIAHNYSKLNVNDVDFSTYKKASLIYGNSKRFLMFALEELFKNNKEVKYSIVHPGVTLTNMTNHYPKIINWLVKLGIKLLFPNPSKASENIIYAIFNDSGYGEWIGPRIFNIWGKPKIINLHTISSEEKKAILGIAQKMYREL